MSNILTLAWRQNRKRGNRPGDWFLDFVIDGTSLRDASEIGDEIGCLGWLDAVQNSTFLSSLLLESPSPIVSGRVPLYICPIDADLACVTKNWTGAR